MKGEQLELEGLADATRARSGLAPDDFTDAVRIVRCVLGPTAIVYERMAFGPATYLRRRADGSFEIVLRPKAPDLRFRLLHEVGHVVLADLGYDGSLADEERAANYLAAAMMAPANVVARAYKHHGERLRPLAKTFGVSQTAMQLRLGEVLQDERSVVTKTGNVFVRSQGAFPWAQVPIVAVARGVMLDSRLEAAALSGGIDSGRVALRAR